MAKANILFVKRHGFQEKNNMEETKGESSARDDLINEIADVLNTPSGRHVGCQRRAAIASSNKASRQLHRMRQYQFGPLLADGCDPESETSPEAPQPDEQAQYMESQFGPPLAGGADLESATLPYAPQPDEQLQYMLSQFGPSVAAAGCDLESTTPARSSVLRQTEEGPPASRRTLAPCRHSRSDKKIARLSPAQRAQLERELADLRAAWQQYRSTNSRDAVYFYLEAVFLLVTRWQGQNCAMKNSRAALGLKPHAPAMQTEPVARLIVCTCDPDVADAKTRSKWSRVLRFARKTKPARQGLTEYIKANGGINACARLFASSR
jgi:hypothetical protein